MISRKAPPATGLDLFGYSRTALSIRVDAKGVAVLDAWEEPVPFGAQVSGALFTTDDGPAGRLLAKPLPNPEAVVVGIEEVPGTINYKPTTFTSPSDLLKQSSDYTTPRAGRADFGLDVPLTHLMPLPRKHDNNTWAALTFDIRIGALLQSVERLQRESPAIRPRLDARFLAPLRAFLLCGNVKPEETLVFSHLDLFDSLHVLVHRGSPVHVVRYQTGLAHFAAEDSSATDESLDEAIAALYRDGFREGSARGYCTLMNMVVEAVRQKLGGVAQAQRMTQDGVRLNRIVLSGPLTDHASLLSTKIRAAGTIPVEEFRPVAALGRVPMPVKQHAGRFTVALGLALNPPRAMDAAGLPVDLTTRLSLDQLPRDRRIPSSIIEAAKPSRLPQRTKARPTLSLAKYARVAQVLYVVPAVAAGLAGYKLLEGRQLDQQIAEEQVRHDRTAALVLQMKDAETERMALAQRVKALSVLEAARAWPAALMQSTGGAMAAAPPDVWLTDLTINATGQVQFTGKAESYPSIAAFFDALRRDSSFTDVTFKKADRSGEGVVFQIQGTVLGIPKAPPAPDVAPGAGGPPGISAAPPA